MNNSSTLLIFDIDGTITAGRNLGIETKLEAGVIDFFQDFLTHESGIVVFLTGRSTSEINEMILNKLLSTVKATTDQLFLYPERGAAFIKVTKSRDGIIKYSINPFKALTELDISNIKEVVKPVLDELNSSTKGNCTAFINPYHEYTCTVEIPAETNISVKLLHQKLCSLFQRNYSVQAAPQCIDVCHKDCSKKAAKKHIMSRFEKLILSGNSYGFGDEKSDWEGSEELGIQYIHVSPLSIVFEGTSAYFSKLSDYGIYEFHGKGTLEFLRRKFPDKRNNAN